MTEDKEEVEEQKQGEEVELRVEEEVVVVT